MIFRNRKYEKALEAEIDRLRAANDHLFNALMRAHGMETMPPKLTTQPTVQGETKQQAVKGTLPWQVIARRVEAAVDKMPKEEVLKKLDAGARS